MEGLERRARCRGRLAVGAAPARPFDGVGKGFRGVGIRRRRLRPFHRFARQVGGRRAEGEDGRVLTLDARILRGRQERRGRDLFPAVEHLDQFRVRTFPLVAVALDAAPPDAPEHVIELALKLWMSVVLVVLESLDVGADARRAQQQAQSGDAPGLRRGGGLEAFDVGTQGGRQRSEHGREGQGVVVAFQQPRARERRAGDAQPQSVGELAEDFAGIVVEHRLARGAGADRPALP